MGIEELHGVQDELVKKLSKTSTLIESRSRSVSKGGTVHSSANKPNLSAR
jgi:hypothetical protein